MGRYTLRRIGVYHHNNPLLFRLKMMPFVRKNYGGLEWRPWKRLSNAKDAGSIIPGHGGVLDRLDSVVVSIPVVYYLLATVFKP